MRETGKLTRTQPCFAISKDGKQGDYRGRPCSVHFWTITAQQLMAACRWELDANSLFEAQTAAGERVVLGQDKGLPIGGHLSAAFVELVALRRELECDWPVSLRGLPTARYRDNFFVVTPTRWNQHQREQLAVDLSVLLMMPVVFERGGSEARVLELRLKWEAGLVRAALAYRTDVDRQGESGDVRTWPQWHDPRAPGLLPGLLAGLARKLSFYAIPEVVGLTASVRQAVAFLRRLGYPSKKWLRPFGMQLLRYGVPAGCLPRCLRQAVQAAKNRQTDGAWRRGTGERRASTSLSLLPNEGRGV